MQNETRVIAEGIRNVHVLSAKKMMSTIGSTVNTDAKIKDFLDLPAIWNTPASVIPCRIDEAGITKAAKAISSAKSQITGWKVRLTQNK
jgi:hypothetical protein